jgi:prolipoprotein diacylglyceryltransferase
MIPYPGFDKIALEIGPIGDFGPLEIHWYGIMYLVAFAAAWWLGRVRAQRPGSTWKLADIDDFMFFGMLGTIIGGRLGYVLFYGMEFWQDDVWWFPVNGQGRHATQLYEAALEGLLLAIVLWWYTSKPRPRMAPVGLFLIIYSVSRIFVEFWRLPDEHLNQAAHGYLAGGWLTMGMLLSAPMLLVGISLFCIAYSRRAPSGNFVAPQPA